MLSPSSFAMGMCALRGPQVLHEEVEDADLVTPRSCATSSTSIYGSASSQDLDHIAEAVGQFYHDGAIWQRTIPRGRRCKPLSFAGLILYDQNGNLLTSPHQLEEDEDMDEYFNPQPTKNLAEREQEFRS